MPVPASVIKLCVTFADHRDHFRSGNSHVAAVCDQREPMRGSDPVAAVCDRRANAEPAGPPVSPQQPASVADRRYNTLQDAAKLKVLDPACGSGSFLIQSDQAAHDRMVSLVDTMLALHPQRADPRTPHEQSALDRQIAATDRQIDRLVYDLYGLTEEEIALVEGA